ncbi:MAG: zinc ribbon domain-containing protein [Deltaproteobacteria bacterium]|nr:zinc ribbon domain-containing protein [Deltaproteobacteria bacterium]
MPIYEFRCRSCGREFEELVRGAKYAVVCPDCGLDDCEKWMSSFRCGSPGSTGADFSGVDYSAASKGSSSCGSCAASSCVGCGSR